MTSRCQSPVLFLVFNRPEVTRQVFEAIRRARVPVLYIAADGPRSEREGEAEKCAEVKEIVSRVDWDCKVATLYRQENLGCAKAVSDAITWFFEQEESGIILEDDCLPDPAFFKFCDELLPLYAHDTRIMQLSACNLVKEVHTAYSYIFAKCGCIWGWASWRRAWRFYQHTYEQIELDDLISQLSHLWTSHFEKKLRTAHLSRSIELNSWAYRWLLARLVHHGLSVIPRTNLARNIGFGADATHTSGSGEHLSDINFEPLSFPLKIPEVTIRNARYEDEYFLIMSRQSRSLWYWFARLQFRFRYCPA